MISDFTSPLNDAVLTIRYKHLQANTYSFWKVEGELSSLCKEMETLNDIIGLNELSSILTIVGHHSHPIHCKNKGVSVMPQYSLQTCIWSDYCMNGLMWLLQVLPVTPSTVKTKVCLSCHNTHSKCRLHLEWLLYNWTHVTLASATCHPILLKTKELKVCLSFQFATLLTPYLFWS